MPPKVEIVEWLDAVASTGWHSDDEPQEPPVHVATIGFVVADEKQYLVVAATWAGGESNNRMTIPKAWIQSRRKLDIDKGKGRTPRTPKHSQGVKKRVRP